MNQALFSSELWKPALDKYAKATGLSVELFAADGQIMLNSAYSTPLVELFREYGFEPGLFAECARRCVAQTTDRPAVAVAEAHGLTVVGTSLVLEGLIVGAAVGGYALAHFSQVAIVHRWAKEAGMPFDRLWSIVRSQAPVPERRLMLHGELLQVLGDALLRENYRTRQFEELTAKLNAAAAAKDEFLAVVSHELRTPLAPILGWASVLKNDKHPQQVARAVEVIERNVRLQSRMVDDLLDMSRLAHRGVKLDLEVLELAALLHTTLELFADDIEKKHIRLEFDEAGEPLPVEGDAGRLQQIFRNILSNAVKFTPEGGGISVKLAREASHARVVISDTGVGIAPDFLPFVFDIFRQQEQGAKREFQGLGIGLSLVKQLTELQKGTVSIESAGTGQGTRVEVRFPVVGEPAGPDDAAQPDAAKLAGLSVLVVEDSADAAETVRAMLQVLGAEVSVAREGREALDMMEGADHDLVLCDLRMPRMDGYEFMRELHRAARRPPVVAMSGFASDTDRERSREAGFEAHLSKPFDQSTLVATVTGAIITPRR